MPNQSTETDDKADAPATKSGRVGNAIAGARGVATDALHETQEAVQRVGRAAEANPVAAIGAGIAVGLAVGALLPRSRRETELLGATGRRITGAASDAIEAARDAARVELATLPLSKDAAKAQVGKVFDQVAKAISGAGEAALTRRPSQSTATDAVDDGDLPAGADADDDADDTPRPARARRAK